MNQCSKGPHMNQCNRTHAVSAHGQGDGAGEEVVAGVVLVALSTITRHQSGRQVP